MDIGDDRLIAFGALVRKGRKALRLSLRELAGRVGLSASYLSSIERGLNPTTGRPPQPSAGAVDNLCAVLGLDRGTALAGPGPAGAAAHHRAHGGGCGGDCEHVLLYRLDERRDGLEAIVRRLGGDRVTEWLCVADPATEPTPADGFHAWVWPFLSAPYPGEYLDVRRIVAALAVEAEKRKASLHGRSYGLVIADCSSVMRWVVNPDAEIAFEDEWCAQSAAALNAVVGHDPAINICVYHQLDFEAMAQRLDRLTMLLRLFETHGRIVALRADGTLVEGREAVAAILREHRPSSVTSTAWRMISGAVAARIA